MTSKFSIQKFREILEERVRGKNTEVAMANYPEVYWQFYADKAVSPIYEKNERQILEMTDNEIECAFARWILEKSNDN